MCITELAMPQQGGAVTQCWHCPLAVCAHPAQALCRSLTTALSFSAALHGVTKLLHLVDSAPESSSAHSQISSTVWRKITPNFPWTFSSESPLLEQYLSLSGINELTKHCRAGVSSYQATPWWLFVSKRQACSNSWQSSKLQLQIHMMQPLTERRVSVWEYYKLCAHASQEPHSQSSQPSKKALPIQHNEGSKNNQQTAFNSHSEFCREFVLRKSRILNRNIQFALEQIRTEEDPCLQRSPFDHGYSRWVCHKLHQTW